MQENSDNTNSRTIREQHRKKVLELMEEFNRLVPNEDAGLALLYEHAEAAGLTKCPSCPDSNIEKLSQRTIKCKRCSKTIWITAGTLFHRVRRVRPYLAALYCREHGAIFGAPWFARLLGIADSLGATIAKKIGLVLVSHLSNDTSEAHSSSFIALICKRSRETPMREHPRAELNTITSAINDNPKPTPSLDTFSSKYDLSENNLDSNTYLPSQDSDVNSGCNDSEQIILHLLSDQPISFDKLCEESKMSAGQLSSILTLLELNGFLKAEPGNKFRRTKRNRATFASNTASSSNSANTNDIESTDSLTENLLAAMHVMAKDISGGFSRKCLQIYAALFWCHFDSPRWSGGQLIKACLRHPPIRNEDIVFYVSPPYIRIAPTIMGAPTV